MLLKIEYFFQRSSRLLGRLLAIVFLLMTVNVFFDVVMRYFFRNSSVGMQEMEWHLFSIVILFGVSVALLEEGHVRVDFLYDRFSIRKKAVINIIGTVFFLTPLACLILFGSFDFVLDSYNIKEISENPGGLHYRYIIKAMIPLAFALLIFFAIGYTVQNINLYRQDKHAAIVSHQHRGGRPMTGIIMFFAALLMLGIGYPVAFTFGSISIFFGIIAAMVAVAPDISFMAVSDEFLRMFSMMPFRVYSIMNNTILMAIPLFIFMGIVLQRSQLAERLLEAMGTLFGRVRGGIAVSTVLVGALLAASTGVVGASVVAMGVISLPVMLKYGYSKPLATGTICAAGTLGQIIPPSVILVILGDVFQLPVGDLFAAAFAPGFGLVGAYIVFILIWAFLNKNVAPAMPPQEGTRLANIGHALTAIIPPFVLIMLVLGSIFIGIATPTESAAVGCIGAMVLAALYRKLNWTDHRGVGG